jgi:hypothetical protein
MHLASEDFELYALEQLPQKRAAAVEQHIAHCPACDAKLKSVIWQAGTRAKERRQHPRTSTDQPAWMQVIEPPRIGAFEVRILDVSREGMSLQTRQHVTRGSKIKIRREDTIIFGEVRYCIPAGGEFRLGIQIREIL